MEWMDNFEDEIGQWIEGIDFGDIIAEAQQNHEQQTEAVMAPPAERTPNETGEQQPPYTEAEMDYALRAISLVQQALPLMNEAFETRAKAQEEEIARLKEAGTKLEEERDTRPAPPWVVIDNSKTTATRKVKKPRTPRKKGTASQEEARRAHRASNARKWGAKRREEERQKEAEGARKRGLRRSNRTVIVLSD